MEYRIGIDMGGTFIKAGLVDESYRILYKDKVATAATFLEVCDQMAALASGLAERAGLTIADIPFVGVGTPGSTVSETGRLAYAMNVNWVDVPLQEELSKRIPTKVRICNDANCAAIGETIAGGGKGCRNVLLITLGTGVGGGIIMDGKLFTGGDGMGVELGHTPLVLGGLRCTCGIIGCFEAYASVTGLIRQTKEMMEKNPDSCMHDWVREHGPVNGKTAYDCAQQGDKAALQVCDQYETYVAAGVGGMINIFRPELVLIGGGISAQGEYLLKPIREKLPDYVFASKVIGVPPVKAAMLGNAAGTIGAAYLDRMI